MTTPEMAPPTENGIDVVEIIEKDLLRYDTVEGRKAVYPMIDTYDYLLWLAARLRAQLPGVLLPPYAAVKADLAEQAARKEEKYGHRLRTHNGRNSLADAYSDLLELITHVGKARLEGKL